MKMLPILVLASSLASASASAVTIDSPEVGQFFKLPSWAPAAVDSEHTPGSPDTVVDVYTNVVKTTEWKFGAIRWFPSNSMYAASFTPTNAVQPTYVKGSGWNLSASLASLARIVPQSEGSNSYSAPGGSVVAADEGAGSLTISVHYSATRQVNGQWYSITTDFYWTLTAAKQEVEPVNTGRKAVRPVRLVPEMFSSLYSSFEAYYERAYYSCCGERNAWDADIYGPTTDDHLFRFDLPDDPEYGAFWCEFQYTSITNNRPDDPLEREPCTNRTILTRRLVDGENVLRLAESVHGSLYSDQRAFPKIFVERPGWQDLTEYQSTSIPYYLIWSSTVFDSMGLTRDFPALEWRRDPITPTSEEYWSRTYTGWRDLAYVSTSCNFDWSSRGSYYKTIPRMMFERVNFGEPPFDDDWQYGGPMPEEITSPLTNVTEEVLAHPYGDRSLITNAIDVTRRLNLSKIGQLNQALACLDRTYYVPQEFPQFFGTREGAKGFRWYEGELYEVPLTGQILSDSAGKWFIKVDGYPVVAQPEFVSASNTTWTSNFTSEYAVVYTDPTHSGLETYNSVMEVRTDRYSSDWIPLSSWSSCNFPLGLVIDEISRAFPHSPDSVYTFDVFPGLLYEYLGRLYLDGLVYPQGGEGYPYVIPVAAWDAPVAIRCRAYASYWRSYEYAATWNGIMDAGALASYPGDFSRAGECDFMSLLSAACVSGTKEHPVSSAVPWPLRYSASHYAYHSWLSGYKTRSDRYTSAVSYRANLVNRANDLCGKCTAYADARVGENWNAPLAMIPMSDGDVSDWLSHLKTDDEVTVEPPTLEIGFSIDWITMGTDDAGEMWFLSAGFYDPSGNPVEVPIDDPWQYMVTGPGPDLDLKIGVEDGHGVIDVEEHYGFLSNGRQSGCAKVDWNWNCLRLNKDE